MKQDQNISESNQTSEPIFAEDLENPVSLLSKVFCKTVEIVKNPSEIGKSMLEACRSTISLIKTGVENINDLHIYSQEISQFPEKNNINRSLKTFRSTVQNSFLVPNLQNHKTRPTKIFSIYSNNVSDNDKKILSPKHKSGINDRLGGVLTTARKDIL